MTTSVGISELNQSNDETKTTVIVTYGDKAAQIELEGLAALFDREPRPELVRREMLRLIEALSEWEKSGSTITWRALDRGK